MGASAQYCGGLNDYQHHGQICLTMSDGERPHAQAENSTDSDLSHLGFAINQSLVVEDIYESPMLDHAASWSHADGRRYSEEFICLLFLILLFSLFPAKGARTTSASYCDRLDTSCRLIIMLLTSTLRAHRSRRQPDPQNPAALAGKHRTSL